MVFVLIAAVLAHLQPATPSGTAPWLDAVAVPPVVVVLEEVEEAPAVWVDDTPSDDLPACPVATLTLIDGEAPATVEGLPTWSCAAPALPADYWTGTPTDEP